VWPLAVTKLKARLENPSLPTAYWVREALPLNNTRARVSRGSECGAKPSRQSAAVLTFTFSIASSGSCLPGRLGCGWHLRALQLCWCLLIGLLQVRLAPGSAPSCRLQSPCEGPTPANANSCPLHGRLAIGLDGVQLLAQVSELCWGASRRAMLPTKNSPLVLDYRAR